MKSINEVSFTVGMSAYGNHDVTTNALQCLFDSIGYDFELILVDDASPDSGKIADLFMRVRDLHKNTKVFIFDQNKEYSGSLNCILSHATGEHVLFVSNDIFVTKEYIESLRNIILENDDIGIIRGVSNFVDNGKESHNIPCAAKNIAEIREFSEGIYRQFGRNYFHEDYLTGDAFLCSRRLIDRIGVLDPLFYGYFADHDYGVRAIQAGFNLAVAKGAFAYHMRDSNFTYLDEAHMHIKAESRFIKVNENWARFKLKYGLPVELSYPGTNVVDWSFINRAPIRLGELYVPPSDYSCFLKK